MSKFKLVKGPFTYARPQHLIQVKNFVTAMFLRVSKFEVPQHRLALKAQKKED